MHTWDGCMEMGVATPKVWLRCVPRCCSNRSLSGSSMGIPLGPVGNCSTGSLTPHTTPLDSSSQDRSHSGCLMNAPEAPHTAMVSHLILVLILFSTFCFFFFFLQMSKLRLREGKQLAQNHKSQQKEELDSNLLLPTAPCCCWWWQLWGWAT